MCELRLVPWMLPKRRHVQSVATSYCVSPSKVEEAEGDGRRRDYSEHNKRGEGDGGDEKKSRKDPCRQLAHSCQFLNFVFLKKCQTFAEHLCVGLSRAASLLGFESLADMRDETTGNATGSSKEWW